MRPFMSFAILVVALWTTWQADAVLTAIGFDGPAAPEMEEIIRPSGETIVMLVVLFIGAIPMAVGVAAVLSLFCKR